MTDVVDRAAEWIADPDSLLTRPTRPLIRELSDCLVALRAERDAALADARRYRWLREHLPQGTINDCDVTDAASWDAAIDAALKEGEK